MTRKEVAIGLSGGVDSAVAAAVLVDPSFAQGYGRARQGYDVTAVFLECWREPGCRTDEDRKDALSVALKLKIPFKVLDFKHEYKQKVVDYFYDEYKAGRTPNPDVMCNKEIKFGLFYDWCLENGFDFVATGHYARIVRNTRKTRRTRKSDNQIIRDSDIRKLRYSESSEFSGYSLCIPKDKHKDQTYFLYRLRQEQLEHILFPVGEMTKVQVRQEAKRRGLPVADKPDSQGICFIGEVNVQQLLRERLPVKKGEVLDTKGQVIGEHDGVWFYTIGQRHGFRTSGGHPPLYVMEKDVKNSRLVVGFGSETYRDKFEVSDVNWLHPPCKASPCEARVRIRHGGELINSKFEIRNSKLLVHLDEPVRGVAPGQSAVFYLPFEAYGEEGWECIGGGVIM